MGNFTSRRRESHGEPSSGPSEAEEASQQSTGGSATSNHKRARVDERNPTAADATVQHASKRRRVDATVRASSKKASRSVPVYKGDTASNSVEAEEERMKSFLTKLKELPEYHPNGPHSWDDNYAQLKLFKEQFGHCRLPSSTREVRRLKTWLAASKCRKNKPYGTSRKLTKEQVDKLEKLGVEWTTSV